ncbi:MAG: hypothetical protein ACK5MO_03705 [Planctomyces sp.]
MSAAGRRTQFKAFAAEGQRAIPDSVVLVRRQSLSESGRLG